ncbi:MAG: S8 family serine peptidase [Phycisphaerales bacterium]
MLTETSASRARAVCLAAAFTLVCSPALADHGTVSQDSHATLKLRYAAFDPIDTVPAVPRVLRADKHPGVYIVQLHDHATDQSRQAITEAGARIGRFLPHNAYIVRMDEHAADAVRSLASVRWVGPFHPAYKLDEPLLQAIVLGTGYATPTRYSIQMLSRGNADQQAVARAIDQMGGQVHGFEPMGFRIEATLTLDQLTAVARRPEVLFIDAKGAPEPDMDIVRLFSGGDRLHGLGFSGRGVRGEVLDGGLRTSHLDFQARPPLIHTANGPVTAHGTAVYGIVFGDGTADPTKTGMLPEGQGIFASYPELGFLDEGPGRYEHTAELVDPDGPYRAVFQTNSWGDPRATDYTTISAQMDDIAFLNDIVITQSQSNSGDRNSRPQAWAKNIISVGGINHESTVGRIDDFHWSASTGPAADGRVKPDLSHFYDSIETTSSAGPGEYTVFNGTSASTPIVAGHFGILYQLWGEGVFRDAVEPLGDVFSRRPSATTARALMINTAQPWTIGDDISRDEQGWGPPNVSNLFDARDSLYIVDQSWTLLHSGDRAEYLVAMPPQGAPLRITMAYLDPPGNPAATVHRINDLDLRVTSPSGKVYHGNVGLHEGLFSAPGGSPNSVDTIENVFVQRAEPGLWTVEVLAQEINEDADLSTPGIDAHFSLVIQGGASAPVCRVDFDRDGKLSIFDFIGYQSAFFDGDLKADFDGDGVLTMFDFILFQSRFVVGCD